jgi:hypothetical protein
MSPFTCRRPFSGGGTLTMKLMGWSWSKARDVVGYELAKAHGWELDEGDVHGDWLLREARRNLDLDEAEA